MKLLFLSIFVLLNLTSCYNPDTKLRVVKNKKKSLILVTTNGERLKFIPYNYRAKLYLEQSKKTHGKGHAKIRKKIKLTIFTSKGEHNIDFNIKNNRDILYTNKPVHINSSESGQPVHLVFTREVEKEFDRINVTVFDRRHKTLLATMQIINDNGDDKHAYDENKGEFLQSYQGIKTSQRSLVFKINGDLDKNMKMGPNFKWVGNLTDSTVNYGALVLVSPWVYSRYWKVNWLLGNDGESDREQEKAWRTALKEAPVVDYVSWVHRGKQGLKKDWMKDKKKHQLRMVYVGACDSKGSKEFIEDYNAAVASGHRNTSASPLFQFSYLRNWVYGRSHKDAIKSAWNWGNGIVSGMDFFNITSWWMRAFGETSPWKNSKEMLYDSEMMISYTPELRSSEVEISLSAVPDRNSKKLKIITEEVSKFTYGKEEDELVNRR